MANNRNKNKNDKNAKKNIEKKAKGTTTKQIVVDESILSQAIISAYRTIQQERMEQEKAQKEKDSSEWNEILRQIEYPQDEKWYKSKLHNVRNMWRAFWKIFFLKPSEVKDARATFALISLVTIGILGTCICGLYMLIFYIFYAMFIGNVDVVLGLVVSFSAWVFARILRIASLEIGKMKDGNLLLAIFSGSVSFVALIVSIIALFH